MAELPEGITQKELDEYAKLDRGIKKLKVRHDILNEKIKNAFSKLGTFVFGSVIIKRSQSNSFDKGAFEKAYPLSRFPQYYTATLDPTLIEADKKVKFTSKTEKLSVDVVAE